MRQLASVQRIESLEPIAGADAIEKARVLGWNVVVKKGEHKAGDRVVYGEVDSLLPERPEFAFLSACHKAAIKNASGEVVLGAGYRIRTVKLRGQVSQGICFPLSILPDPIWPDGADVSEVLGVVKYELPEDLGGMAGVKRSTFPDFIPKTDETRVQVLGGLLAEHRGQRFVMTEKLDGTSFTAFVKGDTFGVCSRNQLLDPADETHMLCALAARLGLAEKMRGAASIGAFAIQGEVVGPSIQGNKYALTEHRLYVFDGYWIGAAEHMSPSTARAMAEGMGLESVPQLGTLTLDHTVDEMVKLAEGKSVLFPKVEREGVVCRPETPSRDYRGNRVSFKAINPKFLLKYEQ
jgi:RNA ligase (TIGR02306 family)